MPIRFAKIEGWIMLAEVCEHRDSKTLLVKGQPVTPIMVVLNQITNKYTLLPRVNISLRHLCPYKDLHEDVYYSVVYESGELEAISDSING